MKGGLKIMNKKGQIAGLGTLMIIFIGVIVTLAMFPSVINTQNLVTEKQDVSNEVDNLGTSCYVFNATGTGYWEVNESDSNCNLTVSNWYSSDDWRASDSQCNLGDVVVTNSTGTKTLTEGTDYNLYAGTGILQMLNTADTTSNSLGDNLTHTDYDYCGEGYNPDSGSRGVARMWGIFAALIILAAAVFGIKRWFS